LINVTCSATNARMKTAYFWFWVLRINKNVEESSFVLTWNSCFWVKFQIMEYFN